MQAEKTTKTCAGSGFRIILCKQSQELHGEKKLPCFKCKNYLLKMQMELP
jgi:hypothetical protein